MKSAVITFPGSNCDRDAVTALQKVGSKIQKIWHQETKLDDDLDLIIIPGGFSYGDYLRSGAMAAISPVMQEVKRLAAKGVKVLGICNGFQIITEAGLLPGVLVRNKKMKFICREVRLRVENAISKHLGFGGRARGHRGAGEQRASRGARAAVAHPLTPPRRSRRSAPRRPARPG